MLCTDIWVDACMGIDEETRRTIATSPVSCKISASAPLSQMRCNVLFAAEISWPALFELVKRNKIKYKELPKFPEVRRDLALLLDESVSYADLRKSAFRVGKKLLKQVGLFDVYRGDKIAEGKKQYALSFVLQDLEKTLTDNDVERVMSKLLSTFQNEFGATLR